ncbi:MAG: hypothetical protein KDJ37_07845 [Hyphomicrobiaceae bacterium]|nr:hypothetical protein [Hyphomicrobiaceae bacterium]
MLRTFLKTVISGILGLLVLGTMAVGGLSAMALKSAPDNTLRAVAITRELATEWSYQAIKPHFVSEIARGLDETATERQFSGLRRLGRLETVESATQTDFRVRYAGSDGIVTTSRLVLEARFEGGSATITVTLKRESGVTMLQHIHIQPGASWRQPVEPATPAAPRGFA